MLTIPAYYAIFYDVEKPKDIANAMHKRIDRKQFLNLIDDMSHKKGVCLDKTWYRIESISTFQISNSLDALSFVVCDVKLKAE